MRKSFIYDANLQGVVDISPGGLETTYRFMVYDVQKKQRGKVSITCNDFEGLNQKELDNLSVAIEKCDGSFDDWWTKYKDLGDMDRLETAERLIPCAIALFRDMQQNQGGKALS